MFTAFAARDQVQSSCRYRSPGGAAHSDIDISVELAGVHDEQAQP
jgi:hypothetical protein